MCRSFCWLYWSIFCNPIPWGHTMECFVYTCISKGVFIPLLHYGMFSECTCIYSIKNVHSPFVLWSVHSRTVHSMLPRDGCQRRINSLLTTIPTNWYTLLLNHLAYTYNRRVLIQPPHCMECSVNGVCSLSLLYIQSIS